MENEASRDHLRMYLFQHIEILAFLQEVEDRIFEFWAYCSHHVGADTVKPRSSFCFSYPFSTRWVENKTNLLLLRFPLYIQVAALLKEI